MTAMPLLFASPGLVNTTSWPSTRKVPVSGRCTPASILTIVDLPAPFSPTRACASPPYSGKLTPWTAATAPNDFDTSWTSSRAGASATDHLPVLLPRGLFRIHRGVFEMFQRAYRERRWPQSHLSSVVVKRCGNTAVAFRPNDVRCCFNVSKQARFRCVHPEEVPVLNGRTPSVKDVAAAAGVSLGTVSNVMNRPEVVSARTRERVERAMSELGFVRNESARKIGAGASRTLAYVMLDGTNPFFHDVAQGIEMAAEDADLSLFICNSNSRAAREEVHVDRLLQQRVQGILITPVDPSASHLDELARRGVPMVIVDRVRDGESCCSVAVDDVLGGRIAVEHLVEQGHTRVAFIGGPESIGQVRERLQGAR